MWWKCAEIKTQTDISLFVFYLKVHKRMLRSPSDSWKKGADRSELRAAKHRASRLPDESEWRRRALSVCWSRDGVLDRWTQTRTNTHTHFFHCTQPFASLTLTLTVIFTVYRSEDFRLRISSSWFKHREKNSSSHFWQHHPFFCNIKNNQVPPVL